MDDNQIIKDDPISYFKSNIQTETQSASSTIFLGVPKSTPTSLWLLFCIALGTHIRSLGPDDPLENYLATHSGILARRIQWTEEPSELQSMGLQIVGHD